MKFVWGIVTSVLLLAVSQRLGWILRSFLNHGIFRITGRISYATYIIHMFVVRLILPSVHQPLYLSGLNIVSFDFYEIVLIESIISFSSWFMDLQRVQ